MKKKLFLVVVSMLLINTTFAQRPSEGGAFENFGANLKAGLMNGVGVDFSTSLHANVKARLGFSYLGLDAKNYMDNEDLEQGQAKFANANLLFDYYPMKNGVFHITAGAYFGNNKILIAADNTDPFSIYDYVIVPDANGYFKGTVKFGGAVKPYFGLGLGRTIPNKRVGFKFEIGAVYQGKMKVESDYLNTSMKPDDVDDSLDIPVLESLRFWPSLTLSLVFRLK